MKTGLVQVKWSVAIFPFPQTSERLSKGPAPEEPQQGRGFRGAVGEIWEVRGDKGKCVQLHLQN